MVTPAIAVLRSGMNIPEVAVQQTCRHCIAAGDFMLTIVKNDDEEHNII